MPRSHFRISIPHWQYAVCGEGGRDGKDGERRHMLHKLELGVQLTGKNSQ